MFYPKAAPVFYVNILLGEILAVILAVILNKK